MGANPIPAGCHTVTPHLVVRNAVEAVDFYEKAFGAVENRRSSDADGKIMHAELRIGDSLIFLNDEFPDWGIHSPLALKGSAVTLHLYVEDADALFAQAVKAGAVETTPLHDAFWGDRYGKLRDPFGHEWAIATHKEDVSPEEIEKRAAIAFGR